LTVDGRQSWRNVRDHIRGRVLDFTYRPGDKLPRDEDIARELDCARSTVHRAMRSLAEEGLVERRRKGGTTVTSDPVTRATLNIPITRLEIEARGHSYGYHLIMREMRSATATIAALFGQNETGPVLHLRALHLRALHLADGRPYMFEDRWISVDTVPEVGQVDFSVISANEWLVRNRPFSRCDVQIYARTPDEDEASNMDITAGAALLVLERTTWIDNAPITHVRVLHAPGYRLVSNG